MIACFVVERTQRQLHADEIDANLDAAMLQALHRDQQLRAASNG